MQLLNKVNMLRQTTAPSVFHATHTIASASIPMETTIPTKANPKPQSTTTEQYNATTEQVITEQATTTTIDNTTEAFKTAHDITTTKNKETTTGYDDIIYTSKGNNDILKGVEMRTTEWDVVMKDGVNTMVNETEAAGQQGEGNNGAGIMAGVIAGVVILIILVLLVVILLYLWRCRLREESRQPQAHRYEDDVDTDKPSFDNPVYEGDSGKSESPTIVLSDNSDRGIDTGEQHMQNKMAVVSPYMTYAEPHLYAVPHKDRSNSMNGHDSDLSSDIYDDILSTNAPDVPAKSTELLNSDVDDNDPDEPDADFMAFIGVNMSNYDDVVIPMTQSPKQRKKSHPYKTISEGLNKIDIDDRSLLNTNIDTDAHISTKDDLNYTDDDFKIDIDNPNTPVKLGSAVQDSNNDITNKIIHPFETINDSQDHLMTEINLETEDIPIPPPRRNSKKVESKLNLKTSQEMAPHLISTVESKDIVKSQSNKTSRQNSNNNLSNTTSRQNSNDSETSQSKTSSWQNSNNSLSSERNKTSRQNSNDSVTSQSKTSSWQNSNNSLSSERNKTSRQNSNDSVTSQSKTSSWQNSNNSLSSERNKTSRQNSNDSVTSQSNSPSKNSTGSLNSQTLRKNSNDSATSKSNITLHQKLNEFTSRQDSNDSVTTQSSFDDRDNDDQPSNLRRFKPAILTALTSFEDDAHERQNTDTDIQNSESDYYNDTDIERYNATCRDDNDETGLYSDVASTSENIHKEDEIRSSLHVTRTGAFPGLVDRGDELSYNDTEHIYNEITNDIQDTPTENVYHDVEHQSEVDTEPTYSEVLETVYYNVEDDTGNDADNEDVTPYAIHYPDSNNKDTSDDQNFVDNELYSTAKHMGSQ
ncbi:unnamed protein product [Owenia fusiformis]|uniref:Uncharacterized protein n=1 Tax=Owenia fusiformis TaxID=6347 RepID=A0A8J1XK37_OWEFU|nr:unnamed protein product [Owenia fusiformis]